MPRLVSSILLLTFLAAWQGGRAHAASCSVAQPHQPSAAEKAFLAGDYQQAETLYRQSLAASHNNPALVADLTRVLLRDEKVSDAAALITPAAANTKSAPLLTALAEVQYRQGTPWLAGSTVADALTLDPCYAPARLASSRIMRLNSRYALAQQELLTAHRLDPYDPAIREAWLNTLPPRQRIEETKLYLATPHGADADRLRHEQQNLADLEARTAGSPHSCHLASPVSTTDIPFAPILDNFNQISAWGLQVALNEKKATLKIDTGASGLYIGRGLAQRAGLTSGAPTRSGGVGDQGLQSGHIAYVDSIRIGSLEFRDCQVEISDRKNIIDDQGLVGMDVFSNFLVTLDFPWRKLTLGPLPPRPGDEAQNVKTLNTESQPDSGGDPAFAWSAPTGTTYLRDPQNRYVAPEMKDYVPVYRIRHTLLIPATLNEKSQRLFILDTGAFTTIVSPEAAREVTAVHGNSYETVRGISGEVNKLYYGNKIVFRFANIRQENVYVTAFDLSSLSRDLGTEVSGLIGASLVNYLVVHIDYRDGLVKFDYSRDRGWQHIR
jgi:tetratricopeptide (TPR) repeat protein